MTLTRRSFGWLRDGIGNLRAAREIENMLALGQIGEIFWYDPTSGGADNSANRPDDANSKLNNVIGLCTAARGDVIVCMRGTETVTETVEFDVSGITLIPETMGINPSAMGEFNALLADTTFTDGPVATITAPCDIDGMGFVSRDTGSLFFSGAACLIGGLSGADNASPFGVVMSRCRFPKWGLSNRIGLAIDGSSDCLIDKCVFEGVGSDFEAGIYLQGATANLEIKDCKFTDCDYALVIGAITGGGPGPDLDFHGNRVLGADSKGINTNAGSGRGIIWDNYFNTDQGASTFDGTTDSLDTQGYQLMGNHYKDESTGPT
ncbi:hypothetical protein LCGC14_1074830 [marine sediment metagenome]|uniref:Right handed beta helix domain-containing protein n=1 Tax=marine sediment metagenome TaxID=412755 RepID=A0A0F9Q046_9ZZZZ